MPAADPQSPGSHARVGYAEICNALRDRRPGPPLSWLPVVRWSRRSGLKPSSALPAPPLIRSRERTRADRRGKRDG